MSTIYNTDGSICNSYTTDTYAIIDCGNPTISLPRWGFPHQVEIKPTPKEGVEMKGLYDVYLIYGEDRADILLKRKEGIIASDDEDAKIKSGLMKDVQDSWDADYLTFIVRRIGDVKVKEKPKEVKQV